jgi:hypothetical protein
MNVPLPSPTSQRGRDGTTIDTGRRWLPTLVDVIGTGESAPLERERTPSSAGTDQTLVDQIREEVLEVARGLARGRRRILPERLMELGQGCWKRVPKAAPHSGEQEHAARHRVDEHEFVAMIRFDEAMPLHIRLR